MRTGRPLGRPLLRETLLAVLVVALTFLNFGHAPVTASGYSELTTESWCGGPVLPDSLGHPPCHACRIGNGADLPPPPACIEPVDFETATVAYAAPLAGLEQPLRVRPAQARAPPALV